MSDSIGTAHGYIVDRVANGATAPTFDGTSLNINKSGTDSRSHIRDNDSKPDGGHILYLDGHASWTPFS